MRGSIGTPMTIEHSKNPKLRGNYIECKTCKNLKYVGGRTPYRCTILHEKRHWTSKVKCSSYSPKNF